MTQIGGRATQLVSITLSMTKDFFLIVDVHRLIDPQCDNVSIFVPLDSLFFSSALPIKNHLKNKRGKKIKRKYMFCMSSSENESK